MFNFYIIQQILSNKNYIAPVQPFNNLKSLELQTGFNKHNVHGLACLFRRTTILHTLILKIINDYKIERRVSTRNYCLNCSLCGTKHAHFLIWVNGWLISVLCCLFQQWNRDLWDLYTSEDEQYWQSQAQTLQPFLNHLKVVEIHGFLECENEVTLAKFLLKNGKALREMTLCTGHCNRDSLRRQKIRSQMMGFSWASSNAKVAFH